MEQKGFDWTTDNGPRTTDQVPGSLFTVHGPVERSPKIFTVSELTRNIRTLLEGQFPEAWVSGEVSNFRPHSSGHFYFSLKDDKAYLNAVMFRGANSKLAFKMEDGLEVICHGRISVYEARGQYQIVVDHIEPKGIGALQLAFEQLKKKLQAEGLFDPARKKSLPFLPRKIGVVTSPTGAAIRDILNILGRRFPSVDLLLVPVPVQGEGAAEAIAQAIRLLNEREDMDVMIVGRGGGSTEDLWAFNEEIVARAIFASKIPIVSAVGHEIDFTIADFVADVRAPTPSAAAELVVPNRSDLLSQVSKLKRRLFQGVQQDFPNWFQRVDDWRSRLEFVWGVGWDKRDQLLKKLVSNLDHLSPLHILAKGYSVVQKGGVALKSNRNLKKGDLLEIIFHHGKAETKVTKPVL